MDGETVTQIRAVAEFLDLSWRFKSIEGWLGPLEGYVLYRLARDGEGNGEIVEIGSWMGRSTAWLAAGSLARGRERVHAVDTFDGGAGLKAEDYPVLKEQGTTYNVFLDNLKGAGLLSQVEPIVADSRTAAAGWRKGSIRLLFIDGDHSYEAVKADVEAWLPHVPSGGYVVFDDVHQNYPGVQRLTAEVTAEAGPLKRVMVVGPVWVTRRREG
jgi:predicted O-methyltransferase YrrM